MTNAYSSPVIIGDPLTYQDASMVEDQEKWAYNQFKSLEKKIPELVDTIYVYDALDKLYYGRDMNVITVFSVVLNPVA